MFNEQGFIFFVIKLKGRGVKDVTVHEFWCFLFERIWPFAFSIAIWARFVSVRACLRACLRPGRAGPPGRKTNILKPQQQCDLMKPLVMYLKL